jgi:hypothetical protein
MVRKPLTGWKLIAMNVFIVFHLCAVFLWGLPDGAFRKKLTTPFAKYVRAVGLWHIWGMFAPGPLASIVDVRATVKYKDGSTAEWICPRMEELPVWQRTSKERYRKWRERIKAQEYMMIWDDAARWIARQKNTKPNNPPVEVKMTRWWTDIPPPNRKRDYQPRAMKVEYKNSFTYSTSPISPKDLQ